MSCLRIAYAGTPEFSVPALHALLASEHTVVAVLTQPDRRAGRGKKLMPSAVKTAALNANIEIIQPENINAHDVIAMLEKLELDVIVVAAFGQIFSERLLALPRYGCLNIHASLLPRWRGASPIQQAILAGDTETGVSIMQMQTGMDTGDVWLQSHYQIKQDETSQSLHDHLSEMSGNSLLLAMESIVTASSKPEAQVEEQVTYCKKIQKNDGLIDWSKSALHTIRMLRAYDPWPGIFTYINGRRIRITNARVETGASSDLPGMVLESGTNGILVACGVNLVRILELIPAGGKRMQAADFANSNTLLGIILGPH